MRRSRLGPYDGGVPGYPRDTEFQFQNAEDEAWERDREREERRDGGRSSPGEWLFGTSQKSLGGIVIWSLEG